MGNNNLRDVLILLFLGACTLGTPVFMLFWIRGNYPAYIDPDMGDSYFLLALYVLALMLVLIVKGWS